MRLIIALLAMALTIGLAPAVQALPQPLFSHAATADMGCCDACPPVDCAVHAMPCCALVPPVGVTMQPIDAPAAGYATVAVAGLDGRYRQPEPPPPRA